jgi:hypothetical protein
VPVASEALRKGRYWEGEAPAEPAFTEGGGLVGASPFRFPDGLSLQFGRHFKPFAVFTRQQGVRFHYTCIPVIRDFLGLLIDLQTAADRVSLTIEFVVLLQVPLPRDGRFKGSMILGKMRTRAVPAVPVLMTALQDQVREVRRQIVFVLGKIGPETKKEPERPARESTAQNACRSRPPRVL